MNLFQKLAVVLLNFALIYFMVYEMFRSPIYSESDLKVAQESAVKLARQGDLENSAIRLLTLAEYAKDDQGLWEDYLVVLHWQGKNHEALSLIKHVNLDESPEYFLESMFNAAWAEKDWDQVSVFSHALSKHYVNEDQPKILDSYWLTVNELIAMNQQALALRILDHMQPIQNLGDEDLLRLVSKYNEIDAAEGQGFVETVYRRDPDRKLARELWLDQQVQIARDGQAAKAEANLKQHLDVYPKDQRARYELMTILAWQDKDALVLESWRSSDLNKAPVYTLNNVAKSMRNQQRYEGAKILYKKSLEHDPSNQDARDGLAATLRDMGYFAQARFVANTIAEPTTGVDALEQQNSSTSAYADRSSVLLDRRERFRAQKRWREALLVQESVLKKQSSSEGFETWAYLNNKASVGDQDRLRNLLRLKAAHPKQSWVNQESMYLLSQTERHEEALDILPQVHRSKLSEAELESIALSARLQGQNDQALELYTLGARKFPSNAQFPLGQSLVLAKLGEYQKSHGILEGLRKDYPANEEIMAAYGVSLERQNRRVEALSFYQNILEDLPKEHWAYRKWVMTLLSFGSAETAFDLAQDNPAVFEKEHWKWLYADRSAIAIRWAELYEPDVEEHQLRIAKAEQYSEENFNFIKRKLPGNKQAIFNAHNDRLRVLNLQKDHQELLRSYEALRNYELELPADSHLIAAKSYLLEDDFESAQESLDQIDRSQDAVDIQQYQILLAKLQEQEALELAQAINARHAPWNSSEDEKRHYPNEAKAKAELNKNMHFAYTGKLAEAERKLREFLERAPANTEIRHQLANVYRWQGLPRKAEKEYELIQAQEPKFLEGNIGSIYTDMDLREYETVPARIDKLVTSTYQSDSVARLQEDWAITSGGSLHVEASFGQGDGGAFASRDLSLTSLLRSPLLKDRYRVFNRNIHKTNNQISGESLTRFGLGLSSESRDLNWSTELSKGRQGGDLGLGLDWRWFFDDHLSVSGLHQSYSDQTPIRAYADEVRLRSHGVNLHYNKRDTWQSTYSVFYGNFTDGNVRTRFNMDFKQGLFRSARRSVDVRQSLSAEKNKDQASVYFNPETLGTIGLGLDYLGTFYQTSKRHFKHGASADIALQNQKGEGNDLLWTISYRHLWQVDKTLNAHYGGTLSQSVYGGEKEDFYGLFGGVNWYF